ncbi:MAG: DUF3572 domain-containing protein [Hyphomicrobium sp.]|nr:DUF3572 domain-containing protein [Hyphomicrobium sp.]
MKDYRQPKRGIDRDRSESIALDALRFLVSDDGRLGRFLGATGLDASELRALATNGDGLAAVLDHLLADESAMLAFAAENGLAPEEVSAAHRTLSGPAETWP